jgi:hypothetical protein
MNTKTNHSISMAGAQYRQPMKGPTRYKLFPDKTIDDGDNRRDETNNFFQHSNFLYVGSSTDQAKKLDRSPKPGDWRIKPKPDQIRHAKHTCATRPFQISAFFLRPHGACPSLKFHWRSDRLVVVAVVTGDNDDDVFDSVVVCVIGMVLITEGRETKASTDPTEDDDDDGIMSVIPINTTTAIRIVFMTELLLLLSLIVILLDTVIYYRW